MPFDVVHGQPAAVETLTRALERRQVHHAYRFEGPEGVGKELAAMALAQALVCTAGVTLGCGRCEACRRALAMTEAEPIVPLHPDVVLVGRGVYPPDLIGGKKELSEISIEQVRRVVLSRVAYSPHEGRAQLFIVRAADELGVAAANALLKTLEEPRPTTHFVLLTAQPETLLDTIRSRTLPIRFSPLSDDVLTTILRARGVDEGRIRGAVDVADGSASRALEATIPEASGAREAFVSSLLECVRAADLGAAVKFAEGLDLERRELAAGLLAVGQSFARSARQLVSEDPRRAEVAAIRHGLVLEAIDAVERNGVANLVLVSLVASLRTGRQVRPGSKPPVVVARR